MSLLSPTRIAAVPIADRRALHVNVVTAATAVLAVEASRDLVVTIVNANPTTDYAGAKVALLGKSLVGVAGNWLSSQSTGYPAADRTGNEIALKKGTTKITIPRAVAETMQEISIVATGTAGSPLTVYTSWTDPAAAAKWVTATVAAPFSKLNDGDKNWKVTVLPKGVVGENTVRIRALSTDQGRTNLFWTEKFLRPDLNWIAITEPTVLYLNNIFDQAAFKVDVFCVGTATAEVRVEATDEPHDVSSFYRALFKETATIGDAYFFTPDREAAYVLARLKCDMTGAGSAIIRFYPRDAAGNTLLHKFSEFGAPGKSNRVVFTGSGEKFVYIPRTTDIDRVHADLRIVGTATVEVALANHYGEIEDPLSDPQASGALYHGDGFDVRPFRTGVAAFAAYENWIATVSSAGILTVSNGVVDGAIALTDLPEWISGDVVDAIGFIPYKQGGPDASGYSRETAMRLCFFTRKGNIYHNLPAVNVGDTNTANLMDFDLSAIYEPVRRVADNASLSSERIPVENPALTTEQKRTHRYEPGLPDWNYEQHTDNIGGFKADGTTPYNGGGLPPTLTRNGVQFIRMVHPFPHGTNPQDAARPYQLSGYLGYPFCVKSKCTVYVPYNGVNATKQVVLGTVDGGRIWTVLHELGTNSRTALHGNDLDYTGLGTYADGALSVVKRNYIYPTAALKDPPNAFRYAAPVSVKSITVSGGKTIVETNGPHGIAPSETVDHLVCFKKNVDDDFDFLENAVTVGQSAQFDSNSAGDGRFYRAIWLSTTTFELRQNYSGVDEKIACHHVHSGNPVKDGVIVGCGEKYPQGWICYIPIPEIDDFTWFNMWTYRERFPFIYRLNSAEEGAQRPVGTIWNDDAGQTLLFASDEARITERGVAIPGRDPAALPHRNTAGVFRIAIADIDDMNAAQVVLEMEEAALGIQHEEGIYHVIGMSRLTYLSRDAEKWISFPLVAKYVGESSGAIYLRSGTTVYRVSKL